MASPRYIKITDKAARAAIKEATESFFLSDKRISEIVAFVMVALEDLRKIQQDRINEVLKFMYPEIDQSWIFSINEMKLKKYPEGADITKKDTEPEKVIEITDNREIALIRERMSGAWINDHRISSISAYFTKALYELQKNQTQYLWHIIAQVCPEAINGKFTFDLDNMMLIENFDAKNQSSDINSSSENK